MIARLLVAFYKHLKAMIYAYSGVFALPETVSRLLYGLLAAADCL